MRQETWSALDDLFAEYPFLKAEGVPNKEIVFASQTLGIPFDPDYIEFIHRYGGAIVGPYRVYGLRRAEAMGIREGSVIDQTLRVWQEDWLGVDNWLIISGDHAGNPFGLDKAGTVWLSDHDFGEVVRIADNFEDFIRRVCLENGSR